jgi:hypothetical protein
MFLLIGQAHSISIQLFIWRFVFHDSLISTALSNQGMGLRYYAIFPGEVGHCHLPMGMPFLDVTGRICSYKKPPTWDTIPEE